MKKADANDVARERGNDAVREDPEAASPIPPLILDYADLTREPIPPREWAVKDRIPWGEM